MISRDQLKQLREQFDEFFQNVSEFTGDPNVLAEIFAKCNLNDPKHIQELQEELEREMAEHARNGTGTERQTTLARNACDPVIPFSAAHGFFFLTEINNGMKLPPEDTSNKEVYQEIYNRLSDNNRLNLKASSLFTKAVLFEGDLFQISTEYQVVETNIGLLMQARLLFNPKIRNMKISIELVNDDETFGDDCRLNNVLFEDPFEVHIMRSLKPIASAIFPVFQIQILYANRPYNYQIWLPFTLNKFVGYDQLPPEQLLQEFETVRLSDA